ncbi:MAG: hypothetical protein ABW156_05665 [Jiangellaceae bacterium]
MPQMPANAASDLLDGLVAIDSVNPGLVPGAAGEAAIVTFLRNRLEAAGFARSRSPRRIGWRPPLFQAAGIPAVVCGRQVAEMHAVDEWGDLRQVRAYPRALMTAFRTFAAAGHAD